jgi:hypothetical protein
VQELESRADLDGRREIGTSVGCAEAERDERRAQALALAQRQIADRGDHRPDGAAVRGSAGLTRTEYRPESPLFLRLNPSE